MKSERNHLAAELAKARDLIQRLLGYVADDGSPGNDAVIDAADAFLSSPSDHGEGRLDGKPKEMPE